MPGVAGAAAAAGGAMLVLFAALLLAFVPLLFPDGRLPGPGWRLPTSALVGVLALSTLATIFGTDRVDPGTPPNPLAIPWVPDWVGTLGVAGRPRGDAGRPGHGRRLDHGALPPGSRRRAPAAQVDARRDRAARPLRRCPRSSASSHDVLSLLGPVTIALIPGAVALAILRYRLYDIDRLISRTIAYTLLSLLLVTTFVLGNLALQAVLANFTSSETLAVAGSTLIAFAAAQPLRRRIQRAVDRRFDRARVDASLIIAAFSTRQRGAVDLEAVVGDVRATTSGALRPAAIGIWLRDDVVLPGEGAAASS